MFYAFYLLYSLFAPSGYASFLESAPYLTSSARNLFIVPQQSEVLLVGKVKLGRDWCGCCINQKRFSSVKLSRVWPPESRRYEKKHNEKHLSLSLSLSRTVCEVLPC